MKNEEAVSPVIGVILMVAITVILAAVIAAFVFGLAGTTSTTKNVGITAVANESGFITTIQGGTDLDKVTNLSRAIDTGAPVEFYAGKPYVGMTNYTAVAGGGAGHRLIVSGKFNDGTSQVLFDKQF
jgi:flagellin-like protein